MPIFIEHQDSITVFFALKFNKGSCNIQLLELFLRIDAIAGEVMPLQLRSCYLKIDLRHEVEKRG